jgi:hypothetical protein
MGIMALDLSNLPEDAATLRAMLVAENALRIAADETA